MIKYSCSESLQNTIDALVSPDESKNDFFTITQKIIDFKPIIDLNCNYLSILKSDSSMLNNLSVNDYFTLSLENNIQESKEVLLLSKGLRNFFNYSYKTGLFSRKMVSEDLNGQLNISIQDLTSQKVFLHKITALEGVYFQISFSWNLSKWIIRTKQESAIFGSKLSSSELSSTIDEIKYMFLQQIHKLTNNHLKMLKDFLHKNVLCCIYVNNCGVLRYDHPDGQFICVEYALSLQSHVLHEISEVLPVLLQMKLTISSKETVSMTFIDKNMQKIEQSVPLHCQNTSKGLKLIATDKNGNILANFKIKSIEFAIIRSILNVLSEYFRNKKEQENCAEVLESELNIIKKALIEGSQSIETLNKFYYKVIESLKVNTANSAVESLRMAVSKIKKKLNYSHDISRCKYDFEEEVDLLEKVKYCQMKDDDYIDAQSVPLSDSKQNDRSTKQSNNMSMNHKRENEALSNLQSLGEPSKSFNLTNLKDDKYVDK